jgi:hypothetical protein
MVFKLKLGLICVSLLSALTFATPALDIQDLEARQAPDNIVYVTNVNTFWQVPPYLLRPTKVLIIISSISQYDNAPVSRPLPYICQVLIR